ncbi:hypothetical protein HN51_067421 [Arachis hypogaea]
MKIGLDHSNLDAKSGGGGEEPQDGRRQRLGRHGVDSGGTRGGALQRVEESPWIGVVDRASRMETWWWLHRDEWRVAGCEWQAMGVTSGEGASDEQWGVAMEREEGEAETRWWHKDGAAAALAARGQNRGSLEHWKRD